MDRQTLTATIDAISSRLASIARQQQMAGYDANRAYETRCLVEKRAALLATLRSL